MTIAYCSSLSNPVKANPVVLAPAALCAGTAGAGCVLIGVTVIGGVTYYIWKHPKKKITANTRGQVFRTEYLEDPEEEGQTWDEPIYARTKPNAKKQCANLAKQYKVNLVGVTHNGRTFICTFKG